MANYTTAQREQMAKDGEAMPDGSNPIANKADLANAIMTIGLNKNVPAAKAWIIKRARDLDAISLLPKSWNVTS